MSYKQKTVSLMVVLIGLAGAGTVWGSSKFSHPGVFSSQADLERMKKVVNKDTSSPMHAGWKRLVRSGSASLEYEPHPTETVYVCGGSAPRKWRKKVESELWFRADAQAAYAHALAWVVTGDKAHARKAIEIMDAWAAVYCKTESVNFGDRQRALESGWVAMPWVGAAEIIRYYDNGSAKWSSSSIKRFNQRVLNKLYSYCNFLSNTQSSVPNQELICADAKMAIGIFQNSRSRYRLGRKQWEGLLETSVHSSGENYEVCRDAVHAQYVIICLIMGAEMAWKQGDDVYGLKFGGQEKPRLWYGVEYLAKLDMGIPQDTPWRKQGIKIFEGHGNRSAGWEMALNHYKNRQKVEMLATEKMVHKYVRPSSGDSHFIRWDTLTHAELDR